MVGHSPAESAKHADWNSTDQVRLRALAPSRPEWSAANVIADDVGTAGARVDAHLTHFRRAFHWPDPRPFSILWREEKRCRLGEGLEPLDYRLLRAKAT